MPAVSWAAPRIFIMKRSFLRYVVLKNTIHAFRGIFSSNHTASASVTSDNTTSCIIPLVHVATTEFQRTLGAMIRNRKTTVQKTKNGQYLNAGMKEINAIETHGSRFIRSTSGSSYTYTAVVVNLLCHVNKVVVTHPLGPHHEIHCSFIVNMTWPNPHRPMKTAT